MDASSAPRTLDVTVTLEAVDSTNVVAIGDTFVPQVLNFNRKITTVVIDFNNQFVQFSGGSAPSVSVSWELQDEDGFPPTSSFSAGTLSLLDSNQQVLASANMNLYDPTEEFPGDFAFQADVPGEFQVFGVMLEFSAIDSGSAFVGSFVLSSDFSPGTTLSLETIPDLADSNPLFTGVWSGFDPNDGSPAFIGISSKLDTVLVDLNATGGCSNAGGGVYMGIVDGKDVESATGSGVPDENVIKGPMSGVCQSNKDAVDIFFFSRYHPDADVIEFRGAFMQRVIDLDADIWVAGAKEMKTVSEAGWVFFNSVTNHPQL